MARNFRRYRGAHPIADLNVTNLIDLGFMLLVIFMVATPLMQQEQAVGVNLPTVAKSSQPSQTPDEKHVAVGVDARGYYVDSPANSLTLAQLRGRLGAFAAEPKPPSSASAATPPFRTRRSPTSSTRCSAPASRG